MVRHLVEAGHRRIAFLGGPEDNDDARERLRGYRDGLAAADAGLEPWELPGRFDEDSGHQAGQALLALDTRPDAVFAANDTMAIACLYALGRGGVRTPDEIAVVGFDDIPLARYVHPALTTMRVDIAELGARALRVLLDPEAGQQITPGSTRGLQPALVVRDSCGARRADGARAPR